MLTHTKWAMEGGSNGWRAVLEKRRLTPVLISSFPETAGLPLFISFSTSCPELDSGARLPLAGGTGNHRDLTIARMSRFSKTTPPRSAASRTATSTMARAKSSAGITWLGNSTRNTG
jgi:hypothetical protein